MKKLLVLISLTVATLAAHGQTTNNLSVVFSADQLSVLQAAWIYDNQLRTNSLSPYSTNESEIYTNAAPAQTFKEFAERLSSLALEEKTLVIQARREAEMLALWRKATPNKQRQAFMILK